MVQPPPPPPPLQPGPATPPPQPRTPGLHLGARRPPASARPGALTVPIPAGWGGGRRAAALRTGRGTGRGTGPGTGPGTGLGTGGGAARRDVTRPAPAAPAHPHVPGGAGPGPAGARPPRPPPQGPPPPVGPRLCPSRPRPAADSACERPKPRRPPPLPPLTSEGRAHDPAGTNRAGAERLLQSLN